MSNETPAREVHRDYCRDCGAKYDLEIADYRCPVCSTQHPDAPRSGIGLADMLAVDGIEFSNGARLDYDPYTETLRVRAPVR